MTNTNQLLHDRGAIEIDEHLGSLLPLLADLDQICGTDGHTALLRGGEIETSTARAWADALRAREVIAVNATRDGNTRRHWRITAEQLRRPSLSWTPGSHVPAGTDGCSIDALNERETATLSLVSEVLRHGHEIGLN